MCNKIAKTIIKKGSTVTYRYIVVIIEIYQKKNLRLPYVGVSEVGSSLGSATLNVIMKNVGIKVYIQWPSQL